MKTRVLSAVIMAPLLAVIWFGGYYLLAICFVIGILGLREFYKAFEESPAFQDTRPSHAVGYISCVLLYLSYLFYAFGLFNIMLWVFMVMLLSFLFMFRVDKRRLTDILVTVFGIFYVLFLSFHVVMIDASDDLIRGFDTYSDAGSAFPGLTSAVWLAAITAFGTDIFAYFTGLLIGKHKLCPKISPKKTIEGAIGGVLGSTILCGIWGWFFVNSFFIHAVIIGFFGSIIAQIGDLSASVLKRKLELKDYGKLIPGHGGILDRFDSVLFTAPFVYYYLYFYNLIWTWAMSPQVYG